MLPKYHYYYTLYLPYKYKHTLMCHEMRILSKDFLISRYGTSPDVFRQQAATKEEKKISNCLHKPSDIWVGEEISVSEIFITSR